MNKNNLQRTYDLYPRENNMNIESENTFSENVTETQNNEKMFNIFNDIEKNIKEVSDNINETNKIQKMYALKNMENAKRIKKNNMNHFKTTAEYYPNHNNFSQNEKLFKYNVPSRIYKPNFDISNNFMSISNSNQFNTPTFFRSGEFDKINNYYKNEEKSEEKKEEKNKEDNKETITTESKILDNCIEIEKEDMPIEQSKNYISCKKQERNAFSEMTDLKIIITTPEYIKGSLFSFSYYQYTLLIPKLNSECIRKSSDFEWLQKKLLILFPATFFPPLPESSFFDKNTLDNVYRKVRELNYYINTISQNILVRSSNFFQDFITLPLNEFQRKKKFYDSINSPISMQNFTTMEGIIDVTIDDQKDSVCCNIISDIKNKSILYNNLDNALRNLILEFDIMSTRINDVAISFEKLSNSYHFTVKGDKINKILMRFSESFSNWGKNYLTQQIFFDEEIREVFKFMSKDLINLNSLNEEFSCARINYMESKKLYFSKDQKVVKKSEKDFENNQICFGFILNRFYDEYSRVNVEHSNKLKNLQIYLQERKDSVFSDYLGLSKLMNME